MRFFLILLALSHTLFSFEFENFKENGIDYVWDDQSLYNQGLNVYLQAFRKLYTELNVENRESHFQETMASELKLNKENPELNHWLLAKKEGQVVGIAIFELNNYPNVYIRELAVLPEFQKQGIGKELNFGIIKSIPQIERIQIVTRHINKPAIDFYLALGFFKSDFCHSQYDPNRYLGMEWINE